MRNRRLLFRLILMVGVLGFLQLGGWIVFRIEPRYEVVRQTLLGNPGIAALTARTVIGQAYLLYVNAPGLVKAGIEQHNEQGYRGTAVSRRRVPGKVRILFLGGSTTYGWKVRDPQATYPAQVGRLLGERLPVGPDGIEVINGGLVAATTAELLTHYLFKYRYYRPDLVVVNTGGNDAIAVVRPGYQPDYSHWRQPLPAVRPWDPGVRWLLHFRPFAAGAVRILYADLVTGRHFERKDGSDPPVKWYHHREWDWVTRARDKDTNVIHLRLRVPDEDLAFAHNLATLIREVRADGADLLLVPFRPRPEPRYNELRRVQFVRNERILRVLAEDYGIDVAPFPAEVISPGNWADDLCHLTADGSTEKARHVVDYLLPLVESVLVGAGDRGRPVRAGAEPSPAFAVPSQPNE